MGQGHDLSLADVSASADVSSMDASGWWRGEQQQQQQQRDEPEGSGSMSRLMQRQLQRGNAEVHNAILPPALPAAAAPRVADLSANSGPHAAAVAGPLQGAPQAIPTEDQVRQRSQAVPSGTGAGAHPVPASIASSSGRPRDAALPPLPPLSMGATFAAAAKSDARQQPPGVVHLPAGRHEAGPASDTTAALAVATGAQLQAVLDGDGGDGGGGGEDEVECIVAHRVVQGEGGQAAMLYKVHWRGTSEAEDEWFPRADLVADFPDAVRQYEAKALHA
jgi:hypothetical protein